MARNVLKWGAEWLKDQGREHASVSITYKRGSRDVGSSLTATVGQTLMEQDSDAGIISWESKDFIIPLAGLLLNDEPIKPQRGDRITDADGNVYEVLGDNNEPPYRLDEYRQRVRVHTKQVEVSST